MKILLAGAKVACLLLLVSIICLPALAINTNLQNKGDVSLITPGCGGNTCGCAWTESTTGGDSYVYGWAWNSGCYWIDIPVSRDSPTSYAAWTISDSAGYNVAGWIALYSWDGTTLASYGQYYANGRWELKMSGGSYFLYLDGVEKAHGVVATNPYQIRSRLCSVEGTYTGRWDDVVYGATEDKYVLGLPESNNQEFVILSDVLNPSNDGLYNTTSGTQASSTYMTGTWARGDAAVPPDVPMENVTINLVNYNSGTVYATNYTGGGFYGTLSIDIKTLVIDAEAPDGLYALHIPGTTTYSNLIWKQSTGATVHWMRDSYSAGDTGTVITYILDGGYWDPATYTYRLEVVDIFGTQYGSDQPIYTQSGSFTHDFGVDDPPGLYFAVLYAHRISDGRDIVFGIDATDLTNLVTIYGYVFNAQNETPISGATVNFTQGAVSVSTPSGIDGNYTATGFGSGTPIEVEATAATFVPYLYNFTMPGPKSVYLNISLAPVTPVYAAGLAIGGIDRDLTYGRPIAGALVNVVNLTTGQLYNTTTNRLGWYLCDVGASCYLVHNRSYDVQASRVGYDASPIYNVTAQGVL